MVEATTRAAEGAITYGQLSAIVTIVLAMLTSLCILNAFFLRLIVSNEISKFAASFSKEVVGKETCNAMRRDCQKLRDAQMQGSHTK